VVGVARVAGAKKIAHPSLFLIVVMIPTVSVLMITHAVEVIVWSLVYWTVEAAPPVANLTDFAFVNYTTLGYGDVLPAKNWRLLGPITAMNGMLLFGWSTAIIFEVLRRAVSTRRHPVEPLTTHVALPCALVAGTTTYFERRVVTMRNVDFDQEPALAIIAVPASVNGTLRRDNRKSRPSVIRA
jgi:hypothetical protein